jgi:hypothetical protein
MIAVSATQTGASQCDVDWYFTAEKNGVLKVVFPFDNVDIESMAELVAINYLVIQKQVMGEATGGAGKTFYLSKGAARKAILRRTDKKQIIKFGAFASFLLPMAEFLTNKKYIQKQPINRQNIDTVNVDIGEYTDTKLEVESPSVGQVVLTAHAVKRYQDRLIEESGDVKNPLRSLINRMKNSELIEVQLPAKVVQHKQKKYDDGPFRVFKHPDSTVNFGFVQKPDGRMYLVTVFVKKQDN